MLKKLRSWHSVPKRLDPWKKSYDIPRQHIKKQKHHFADKCPSSQSYGYSSSHVWTWELDHKVGWGPKNWCFWTVWMEKTLENPLDSKEINLVNPKGNQPWIVIGKTDAEAEAPIFWPPDMKSQLTGKDSDAGKDWKQEEKGVKEDEMIGWHHWLNGLEFEPTLGDGEGQESLACCSPRAHKEWGTTEWLNNQSPWEELSLKLKFWYFGHLMWRADSLEKTLTLEKIEGKRRLGWQSMRMIKYHHQLNGHVFEQTPGGSGEQRSLVCCSTWCHQESDSTEWLSMHALPGHSRKL